MGKGWWARVGGYTIFSQQKGKARELESVVITRERKLKAREPTDEIRGRLSCNVAVSDCSPMANSCMRIRASSGKSDKIETLPGCPFTVKKMAVLMVEMFLVGFKWPSLWINYIPRSSTE